jgi:hypothetical protein
MIITIIIHTIIIVRAVTMLLEMDLNSLLEFQELLG